MNYDSAESENYFFDLRRNALEQAKKLESFDQAISPVLDRLIELPFSPVDTCSGHLDSNDTNRISENKIFHDKYKFPHLYLVEDDDMRDEISESFRKNIPDLEKSINDRFGKKIVSIDLEPALMQDGEDSYRRLTWEETFRYQEPFSIHFDVIDEDIRDHEGRKALIAIWEEFWKYLGRFDHKDLPVPDFKNGDVFIKKEK